MPKKISLAWDTSGVESWVKSKYVSTADSDEADVSPHEVVDDDDAPAEIKKYARAQRQRNKGKKGEKAKKPARYGYDRDTHGGYRTMTYDNKSSGYDIFARVGVFPVGTPSDQSPKLLLAMTLRPAAGDLAGPSLDQFDRLTKRGYVMDEVITDRGFSYKTPITGPTNS